MKLFTNDKTLWVSETEFLKRYRSRIPNTKIGIYGRYVEKYKTIFNWLCIAYNGKENFGKFGREITKIINLMVKKSGSKKS
jgi:hypothetical protein